MLLGLGTWLINTGTLEGHLFTLINQLPDIIYIQSIVNPKLQQYTPYSCDCWEYIAESWVYIWQLVVEWVYMQQHRETENVCFRNGKADSPHSSLGKPLPILTYRAPLLYSFLVQQPKSHTKFPGYSFSDTVLTWWVEPRIAGQTYHFPAASNYTNIYWLTRWLI